ncbi:MAG TPA: hypothetical protein VF429_08820, partial [Anaerolineae bacterium]
KIRSKGERPSAFFHPSSLIFLTLLFAACAPIPIPTATLFTPTRPPSPTATVTPTSTQTPSLTPTAAATETMTATPAPSLTATPFVYERSPRALLIEADVADSAAIVPADMHVPLWRLYGDGLVVSAGDRAPLSAGMDSVTRVGHLSESEIQNLLAYLSGVGFFSLNDSYVPRPAPVDAPTAHITVFLSKAKTVQVYAPDAEGAPQNFSAALTRLTQTVPADAQTFAPTDAYLESTDAGPVSSFVAKSAPGDWAVAGVRLADAINGITISGSAFTQASALIAKNLPSTLFRDGDRVYRVRFAPNLPRGIHPSAWVGTILDAPREFDGRIFDLVGYFRGANLYGEAAGNPPVTRSDWVIADNSGAIWVTGAAPVGLDPSARADAWSVIHLSARVVYARLGVSHLEVRRVEILSRGAPTPTPTLAVTATATITVTRTVTSTVNITPTRTVTATIVP